MLLASPPVNVDVQAPQKCLPYGKTVNSEVHNWDPDTARDTEKGNNVKDAEEMEWREAPGARVIGIKREK